MARDISDVRWDETFDAVIIGSGFAGLVAAREAAITCDRVLVVEKMPYSGGNSRISGGGYCCWDSKLKLREELELGEDSWQLHAADTLKAGAGYNFPELVEVLAKEAPAGLDLLVDAGIPFRSSLPRIGGHSAYRSYQIACSGSETMDKLLAYCMASGNVELRKNTCVTGLVREGSGRVSGVVVEGALGEVAIAATRGVIIASGGYAGDVTMRTAYKPSLTDAYNCTNHRGATGEVIRLAKAVGADALHMEFVQLYPCADPATGGIDQGAFLCYSGTGYGLVYVDSTGARFVNELGSREHVSNAQVSLASSPTYSILTDDVFERLDIGMDDRDRMVQRARAYRAESLEALAHAVGFDPSVFVASIGQHNDAVAAGSDLIFGKPMTGQMLPLAHGSFYAIPQWPSVHYCMGGLRIDCDARVIGVDDKVIPGLYAAGEVCGGVHGIDRLGGNGIAECVVFGRRAGRLLD